MSETPASRFGVKARFDGACGLCGSEVRVGERIYRLPSKRTGAAGPWVCAACRWNDPGRLIDIAFLRRKVTYRFERRPNYCPTLAEISVILDAVGGLIGGFAPEEIYVLEALERAQDEHRSTPLGKAAMATLLGLLDRVDSESGS